MTHPITRRHKIIAVAATTALLGAAVPIALASTASADTEVRGMCSMKKAHYDFEVEKEDGRFEVNFEADSNVRGQKWRMTLFHDGTRVFRDVRTTDREGEAEFERHRRNTKGNDTFRVRAVNLGNNEVCAARIVRR